MANGDTAWKVMSHGRLERRGNVWCVEGALDGMPLKRVMTVAMTTDGKLVVHNPIAMDEAGMASLDALGEVAFIVVPSGFHRIDAPRFKARYPDAKVVCPSGSKAKVSARLPVDLTYEEFPNDAAIEFRTLGGVANVEGVILVKSGGEVTLVMNDALFNMPHLSGSQGFVLKYLTQSSGGPRISRIFRWFFLKDKAAYRASLEALARTPNLARIVVAHHEVIETDPSGTLERVAATV